MLQVDIHHRRAAGQRTEVMSTEVWCLDKQKKLYKTQKKQNSSPENMSENWFGNRDRFGPSPSKCTQPTNVKNRCCKQVRRWVNTCTHAHVLFNKPNFLHRTEIKKNPWKLIPFDTMQVTLHQSGIQDKSRGCLGKLAKISVAPLMCHYTMIKKIYIRKDC